MVRERLNSFPKQVFLSSCQLFSILLTPSKANSVFSSLISASVTELTFTLVHFRHPSHPPHFGIAAAAAQRNFHRPSFTFLFYLCLLGFFSSFILARIFPSLPPFPLLSFFPLVLSSIYHSLLLAHIHLSRNVSILSIVSYFLYIPCHIFVCCNFCFIFLFL